MSKYFLSQRIGDPVTIIVPAEYGTDAASTETVGVLGNGVPIRDAEGVIFMLTTGDLTTDELTVSITYSSTGSASDATASTTTFLGATDCVFVALDSDDEGDVSVIDINLGHLGISDGPGKFYASLENTGGSMAACIGFPYHLKRSPATKAITIKYPDL